MRLFEILDKNENALTLVTTEALLAGRPAS